MFKARKTAPKNTTSLSDSHAFRVWADSPSYDEDPCPWKCVAVFIYLMDALDYIAAQQDCGSDVVFQSPAHTTLIKADGRRVVYAG